jgi:hypothetical protein
LRDHLFELLDGAQPAALDEFGTGGARMFSYWDGGSYEGVEAVAAATTAITAAGRVTETSWWAWRAEESRWELTSLLRTEGPRAALFLDPRLGAFSRGGLIIFDPSGPPPEPTPVVPTVSFAEFVGTAAAAVNSGNPEFFAERINTFYVLCTEANTPPQGIGAPPCDRVGDELDVITWDFGGEGGLIRRANAEAAVRRWFAGNMSGEDDQYGPGGVRIFAYNDRGATGSLALTSIKDPSQPGFAEPTRSVEYISFEFVDGDWHMAGGGSPAFASLEEWFALSGPQLEGWERWED